MAGANLETMASARNKRKGSISEDDVSHILQRYTATTILTLLQEVSQAVLTASKIDWKNLVRKTGTGITSAREYQLLWRHLAYREDFSDRIEDQGSDPLDIDSDLDFEIEADPKPSEEILSESSLCVKLLLNSSNPDIPTPHNNASANENATRVPSEKHQVRIPRGAAASTNNFPSVDIKPNIVPPPGSSVDAIDVAVPVAPAKKKRKQWTKEEDNDLIAAVQKIGESNWAKIEADLKSERTQHQLQLRWNLIKKKGGVNPKSEPKSAAASWEEIKAAQETFSLAVGTFSIRPVGPNPTPAAQNNTGLVQPSTDPKPPPKHLHPSNPIQPHHKPLNPTPPSLNPNPTLKPQKPSVTPKNPNPPPIVKPNGPNPPGPTKPNGPNPPGPTKSNGPNQSGPIKPNGQNQSVVVKPNGPNQPGPVRPNGPNQSGPIRPSGPNQPGPVKPNGSGPIKPNGPSPSSLIQAAAFAAGGRIATPSTAASLLKAAQSKNVVHIRSGGVTISNKPIINAHTTIGVRAPAVNSNLGLSLGSNVVEVDKHGFIEKKDVAVVVKGVGNGGKENGSNGKEENKEKAGL